MEPPIQARNMLVCRAVEHNPLDTEAPYNLRGVLCRMRPPDDVGYPLCAEALWVYVELFGDPGRYRAYVALVKVDPEGGDAGPPAVVSQPTPVRVRPGAFVDGTKCGLFQVPFDTPGVYEFRLLLDGFDEPIASVRLYLMEV